MAHERDVGLGLLLDADTAGRVYIEQVLQSSIADVSGQVLKGDEILEVNGVVMRGKHARDVQAVIASNSSSAVTMRLNRGGRVLDVSAGTHHPACPVPYSFSSVTLAAFNAVHDMRAHPYALQVKLPRSASGMSMSLPASRDASASPSRSRGGGGGGGGGHDLSGIDAQVQRCTRALLVVSLHTFLCPMHHFFAQHAFLCAPRCSTSFGMRRTTTRGSWRRPSHSPAAGTPRACKRS